MDGSRFDDSQLKNGLSSWSTVDEREKGLDEQVGPNLLWGKPQRNLSQASGTSQSMER